jgi:hypothetical protein
MKTIGFVELKDLQMGNYRMRRIGIYSEREEEAVTMTVTDKKKNNAF